MVAGGVLAGERFVVNRPNGRREQFCCSYPHYRGSNLHRGVRQRALLRCEGFALFEGTAAAILPGLLFLPVAWFTGAHYLWRVEAMRARNVCCCAVWWTLLGFAALAEEPAAPESQQVASCPTVLPAEAGERSIIVPTIVPHVEATHVASRPQSPQHEVELSLLHEKLARRDQLQREITALRESTQTPEQIFLTVKLVEINRTKLRQLNVDWSIFDNGKHRSVDVVGLLGIKPGSNPAELHMQPNVDPAVLKLFDALVRQDVAKILATPAVTVISGRPASIAVGGELPVPQPAPPGGITIQKYGTQLDVLAVSIGENRVRIEIHPRFSELDTTHTIVVDGQSTPRLSVREFDTAVEMEFGKIMVMSGLGQERKVARSSWQGRNQEQVEEFTLILAVTSQIVR
jgi:hypothetical protein